MKPYLLLFAIAYSYCCNATCMLSRLPIEERTQKSTTIIQGKVIKQDYCWNAEKTLIYTIHTIEVDNALKGNIASKIEIITPGGSLDGKLIVVEPNAELKVGSEGIFFLNANTIGLQHTSTLKKYEIYGAAQGFVEQDIFTGKLKDPFDEYTNLNKVYSLVGASSTVPVSNARVGEDNTTEGNEGTPAISAFTPSTISAGTQSVLTISGWGFKEKTGAATVQFRNANSVLANSFISIPDSTYIVSWTDTEIKVIVPGASAAGIAGSGSGVFRVIDKNGFTIESETPLTISYNQFEYKKNKLILANTNNKGGYTFTFNNALSSDIKASFTRALNQWVCKTGVNAEINTTTSSANCVDHLDAYNTISLATSSCPLPAGALAATYTSYSICNLNAPIFPESIDMVFNPNSSFYYGTGTTPSTQYDFESVVLHELGHAFGQGHNSNNTEVMYPSLSNGATKRVLNENSDIANISDVVNRSTQTKSCYYEKHILSPNVCTQQTNNTPIITQFVSNKTTGCVPFTIQLTDQSSGNPTAWKWDISNNGTIDYTTQNPSHTFTTAGTYAIKLTAYNNTTKDSITKISYITVAPELKLNVDVVQNVSCNNGNNGILKAMPSGGNGTYTFLWNNNQTIPQLSNAAAGTYSVTVKDGFSCSASNSKTITQPEPIKVNITTEEINGKSTATINVTGGTAPYTYVLNNTLEIFSTIFNNLNSGFYNVVVKDKNNCIQNASFSVEASTPVNETEMQFEALDVYPNPASNFVNVNLSLKEYKDVKMELYDLAGRTIYYNEFNNIKEQQVAVDLSSLSAGTYLLKFGLPEGSTFRKIIVSK